MRVIEKLQKKFGGASDEPAAGEAADSSGDSKSAESSAPPSGAYTGPSDSSNDVSILLHITYTYIY